MPRRGVSFLAGQGASAGVAGIGNSAIRGAGGNPKGAEIEIAGNRLDRQEADVSPGHSPIYSCGALAEKEPALENEKTCDFILKCKSLVR